MRISRLHFFALILAFVAFFCLKDWHLPDETAPASRPDSDSVSKVERTERKEVVVEAKPIRQNFNQKGVERVLTPQLAPESPSHPEFVEVYAEEWEKGSEKEGGRRVRVGRAGFKYPNLRIVEELVVDAETGERTERFVEASVADHLILVPSEDQSIEELQRILVRQGFVVRDQVDDDLLLVEVDDWQTVDAQEKAILNLGALEEFIDVAEPDYLVFPTLEPNDTHFGLLWGLNRQIEQFSLDSDIDIDAPEAWEHRRRASDVVVGVTDTGIDYNHPDLAANMWMDGNGNFGFDAFASDSDPMDEQGHGTHCAGTIGAVGDNGQGVAGVAWDVKLMALRFLGPNGGATSDGIRVINYARLNGADIISASWGGGGYSASLRRAIEQCGEEGIPFVAAAGNDRSNNEFRPMYPSSYDLPTLVSVASHDQSGGLSSFSNWGANSVDLSAPGSDIYSTYPFSGYRFLSGTSMATPHVAGALALAKAEFGGEAMDLITRLYNSVERSSRLEGLVATGGRLNLHRLLTQSSAIPTNDNLATAHEFPIEGGDWSGSNRRATKEPFEDQRLDDAAGQRSLWFKWTAPEDGRVNLTVQADEQDVNVKIYRAVTPSNLIALRAKDQIVANDGNTIYFSVKRGREYVVEIDSNDAEGGWLSLLLAPMPQNDFISDATKLTGLKFEVEGTNRYATSELFEQAPPFNTGPGAGATVWYQWRAPDDVDFIFTTQGSGLDTVMSIYQGRNPSELNLIARNDDNQLVSFASQIEFSALKNETYWIAIDVSQKPYLETAGGSFTLTGLQAGSIRILDQPADQEAFLGNRVTFNISLFGISSQITYQWFKDGEAIPGAEFSSYVIPSVVSEDYGSYRVRVTSPLESVLSEPGILEELRSPPRILNVQERVASLAGEDAQLIVAVTGSRPLTYQWKKNGVLLAGETGPSLSFAPAVTEDAGTYEMTVENDLGSDRVIIDFSVVNSPFDQWSDIREGVINSQVNDLQEIDGKLFAVFDSEIRVSDDGERWTSYPLPNSFVGKKLVKFDGEFFCYGERIILSGFQLIEPAVVRSIDGAEWGDFEDTSLHVREAYREKITEFNGKLIASTEYSQVSSMPAKIKVSSDGLVWTTVANSINHPVVWNGKLFAAANDEIRESSNGEDWDVIHSIPGVSSNSDASGISVINNELWCSFRYRLYKTSDLQNWTTTVVESSGWPTVDPVNRYLKDGNYLSFRHGTPNFYVGPALDEIPITSNSYPTDGIVTATAQFNGDIYAGTFNGRIERVSDLDELVARESINFDFEDLRFIDNQFMVFYEAEYQKSQKVLVSPDGFRWRTFDDYYLSNGRDAVPSFYWNNRYLNVNRIFDASYGYIPFRTNPQTDDVPATGRLGVVAQASDSQKTLVAASNGKIFRFVDGVAEWEDLNETIAPDVQFPSFVSVCYNGSLWLAVGRNYCYVSADADTWTRSDYFGSVTSATVLGDSFCLVAGGNILKSTDGMNWTTHQVQADIPVNPQIAPPIEFNGSLVARVLNRSDSVLIVSNDGENWARARAPRDLVALVKGHGKLIGATRSGRIVVAAMNSEAASVRGPMLTLDYPQPNSKLVVDGPVEFTGSVENWVPGSTVTLVVDGQVIDTDDREDFQIRYLPSQLGASTAVVRVVDPSGLVSFDFIDFEVVNASGGLGLANPDFSLPGQFSHFYKGFLYSADDNQLWRSPNGFSWQRMELPDFGRSITSLTSVGERLIIELDGQFASSEDGINWVGYSPRSRSSENVLRRYPTRLLSTGFRFSDDGLNWQSLAVNPPNPVNATTFSYSEPYFSVSAREGIYVMNEQNGRWFFYDEFLGSLDNNGAPLVSAHLVTEDVWLVLTIDEKLHFSTDLGNTWTTLENFGLGEVINRFDASFKEVRGRIFLVQDSRLVSFSDDQGQTWTQTLGDLPRSADLVSFDARYYAPGYVGVVVSSDLINWERVEGGPVVALDGSLGVLDQKLVVGDSNGGLWASSDGEAFELSIEPREINIRSLDFGSRIGKIEFKGLTVEYGTQGSLFFKRAESALWERGTVLGQRPERRSDYHFLELLHSQEMAVARMVGGQILSSSTGVDWIPIENFLGERVLSCKYADGAWMLVTSDGLLHRSLDETETWSVIDLPAQVYGQSIHYFDGSWFLLGASSPESSNQLSLYRSPDGLSWTDVGLPGGQNGTSPQSNLVVHQGKMAIAFANGEIYSATGSELNWQAGSYELPRTFNFVPQLLVVGEHYYLAPKVNLVISSDGHYAFSHSSDLLNWSPIQGASSINEPMFVGEYFISNGFFGSPQRSFDGITWEPFSLPANAWSFNHDSTSSSVSFRAITGSTFSEAEDGSWAELDPWYETETSMEGGSGRKVTQFGSGLLLAGERGLLAYQALDSSVWQSAVIPGDLFRLSLDFLRLESSDTLAAAFYDTGIGRMGVLVSSDGESWQHLRLPSGIDIVDIAYHGGVWIVVDRQGSVFQSNDETRSWQKIEFEGLQSAEGVAHSSGRWHLIDYSAEASRYSVWSSDNLTDWTLGLANAGNPGFLIRSSSESYLFVNGVISHDGVIWTDVGFPEDAYSIRRATFNDSPEGLVAVGINRSLNNDMWVLDWGATEWENRALYASDLVALDRIGNRLFLFREQGAEERLEDDFSMELLNETSMSLGVGDNLESTVRISGLIDNSQAENGLTIAVWSSSDRFFGDENDLQLGRQFIDGGSLTGRGDSVEIDFTIQLDESIRPGDHFLIYRIIGISDSNSLNNHAVTQTKVLNVPSFTLSINTNGDGRVLSDFSGRLYPRGANVSVIASAAKGSRFSGWSGDISGFRAINTVTMTQNFSITANFESSVPVQVRIDGRGEVGGQDATGLYPLGSEVVLDAIPAPGWSLVSWSGDVSTTASSVQFTADEAKSIRVEFTQTMAAWKSEFFGASLASSGDQDDADGDGLLNWQEYLLNSNPLDRSSNGLIGSTIDDGYFSIIFTRHAGTPPGYSLTCEAKLENEPWSAALVEERILETRNGIERVEARIPSDAHQTGMIRLKFASPNASAVK